MKIILDLFLSFSLLSHALGAWFFLHSTRNLTNDCKGGQDGRNCPNSRRSSVECALRCNLGNGACIFAAGSQTQHCSLLTQEQEIDVLQGNDIQIFQYTDLDECSLGMSNCHKTAICTNTIASFTCSCPAGHAGYGITECVNVDECVTGTAQCHEYADCTDTEGSYTCECKAGFQGDGRTCENIDECTDGKHNCSKYSSGCVDQIGSFSCKCRAGFIGDGNTCRAYLVIQFYKRASSVPHSYLRVNGHSGLSICLWVKYSTAGVIATVWYEQPKQHVCYTMTMDVSLSLSSIKVYGPRFTTMSVETTAGVWNHVCLTRHKSVQFLYLNKTMHSASQVPYPYPYIGQSYLHLSLGNPGSASDVDNSDCQSMHSVNTFHGEIKDVLGWTCLLSSEQVESIYHGSDIPADQMWISWPGSFNHPHRYPEQTKLSYTLQQLTEIHESN